MTGKPRINRALAVLVALVATAAGAQIAADARLRPDWNDLVAAAAGHGLILSGTPAIGWTGLTVAGASVTGAPFLPGGATDQLTLGRSIWNLFRLDVTATRPVTLVFPDGRQLDLWSRGVRLERAGGGWHVEGAGIGAALHGGGPDDMTSIEAVRGEVADQADGWQLTLAARDVTLPARGTWPNGRIVARMAATLRLGRGTNAARDTVALRDAEISWAGQTARLSFDGGLDDHGLLAGRGTVELGPGWATTLKRAHAAGTLSAGEAEAAIGFLGLLAPDERSAVAFPVMAAAGRIAIGRSTLFALPRFPIAR